MKRFAWCLLALAGCAQAQGSLQRGEVTVYYSAQATEALSTEIARQYAITRSPNRALLSLVLIRADAAIAGKVSGSATNLAGERQDIVAREVRESGGGVTLLAEPRIAARDALSFDLTVVPEGGGEPIPVRFTQEFFPPSGR